jgi:peroxiredoxin
MKSCRSLRRSLAVALGVAALYAAQVFAALPTPGSAAPDFTLKGTNGQNVRLKEQRGQVVLVNFWATWCAPCRQELPALDKLQTQYGKTGLRLLAVSVDEDGGKADAMARQLGLKLTVLHDRDKLVAKRYDVDAMPATVIVDRKGQVRFVHRGYRAGYEKTYEQQIRELLRE